MHNQELHFEQVSVYALAEELTKHQFTAGVAVVRREDDGERVTMFREDRIEDGRVWESPEDALAGAIKKGVNVANRFTSD